MLAVGRYAAAALEENKLPEAEVIGFGDSLGAQDLPSVTKSEILMNSRSALPLRFTVLSLRFGLLVPPSVFHDLPGRPRSNVETPSLVDAIHNLAITGETVG